MPARAYGRFCAARAVARPAPPSGPIPSAALAAPCYGPPGGKLAARRRRVVPGAPARQHASQHRDLRTRERIATLNAERVGRAVATRAMRAVRRRSARALGPARALRCAILRLRCSLRLRRASVYSRLASSY
jgi:hypothetical protein